jgi:hypothetical protein
MGEHVIDDCVASGAQLPACDDLAHHMFDLVIANTRDHPADAGRALHRAQSQQGTIDQCQLGRAGRLPAQQDP